MKLINLEISNIRGIKYLKICPNGKNFVIWGPNGSGKSAVVDSIDFLFTGEISRLTGRGTGNITLTEHGPHIDCASIDDAWVSGTFKLPNKNEIALKRCLASPHKLDYDKKYEKILKPILAVAKRGQHVLTRRDILRYITAEASTRATEIQQLLNLIKIGKIRKNIVKCKNKLETDFKALTKQIELAKGHVNSTTQINKFDESEILKFVNTNRSILGGESISDIKSSNILKNIPRQTFSESEKKVNITILERDIQNLNTLSTEEFQTQLSGIETDLRDLVTQITDNEELCRDLSCIDLIKLGLKLIEDNGNCPLCDTTWPKGKLKEYLEKKAKNANEAFMLQKKLVTLSTQIKEKILNIMGSIENVLEITKNLTLSADYEKIVAWNKKLTNLLSVLEDPRERYLKDQITSDEVNKLFYPETGNEMLLKIVKKAKEENPTTTPEQDAWETLIRLEENLKAYEDIQNKCKDAKLFLKRAELLSKLYIESRDEILQSLYTKIEDRFVELYRCLHGIDEKNFSASISATDTGLNFNVDFYGRGKHPPHALHSEGHQDSMGICLWLTLSEYLTQGVIDLAILDDVVMSVDAEHRKFTCNLLAKKFPNRQFLVTTHDRTWVNQLKFGGFVQIQNMIEFYNWHIETGPQVNLKEEMWTKIDDDLKLNDVSSASARLRRGSENFFRSICNSLMAPVVFREDYRWELGHFLPSAMEQYKQLLKLAIKSAKSWEKDDLVDNLKEQDSIRHQVYARTFAERWALNASVHYNNWENLSIEEFTTLVEAFKDLYNLFLCSKCNSILELSTIGLKPSTVRCKCNGFNWNLIKKS